MVQFSTIVFCVQELSSIAKRNNQEGFLMMCPNRKKRILWYFSNSVLEFLFLLTLNPDAFVNVGHVNFFLQITLDCPKNEHGQ